jgi:hypothetical protein
MKNIYLIPTDQPSMLHKAFDEAFILSIFPTLTNGLYKSVPYFSYITSDEEIKQGDWTLMFDDFGNLFLCDKPQQYLGIEKGHHLNKGLRKIILTTDPTLIADGVQAIDDEFLKWFVKNPTCEFVEVKHFNNDCHGECGICDNSCGNYYRVIIPQEEPKQYPIGGYAPGFYSCKCVNCKIEFTGDKRAVQCKPCAIKMTQEETKQDLEEAAAKYAKRSSSAVFQELHAEDFIAGAKWQRMYSEEEVINAFNEGQALNVRGKLIQGKEWFEQFKKK